MLIDVLKVVKKSKFVKQVLVVSSDKKVLEVAVKMGVNVYDEKKSIGLNWSIKNICDILEKKDTRSILILPIDIPLIKTEDIDNMIKKIVFPKSIIITPSLDEKGTNALLCIPPKVITPSYGINSYELHIKEAKIHNIPYTIIKSKNIALDIDTPKDMALFLELGEGTSTYNNLIELGLVDRIHKYISH